MPSVQPDVAIVDGEVDQDDQTDRAGNHRPGQPAEKAGKDQTGHKIGTVELLSRSHRCTSFCSNVVFETSTGGWRPRNSPRPTNPSISPMPRLRNSLWPISPV